MSNPTLPARMPLNETSWQGIKAVALSGRAKKYWQPGDTKTIVLNGEVAGARFDNVALDAFILGIYHNERLEGRNRIHFGIGMKDGYLVGLRDELYGLHIGLLSRDKGFCMNVERAYGAATFRPDNTGGWEKSYMRTHVLGADKSPTSPAEGTLLAALPRALREVMAPAFKYTLNGVDGDFDVSCFDVPSSVTATADSLWLLSETEVHGKTVFSSCHEKEKQEQYDYFKTRDSWNDRKIIAYNSAFPLAVMTFCRSMAVAHNGDFCSLNLAGGCSHKLACLSNAVLACFAV